MKHIRPASATQSAWKNSTCKIVEEQARLKLSDILKAEKDRIGNQPVRLSLLKPKHEDTREAEMGRPLTFCEK